MAYIEFGGIKNGYFRRNIYLQIEAPDFYDKLDRLIKEYHNTDIYASIYEYETENVKECDICAPLYLDFDGDIEQEKEYQSLKRQVVQAMNYFRERFEIPYNMQQLYFSGHKGFHIIIQPEVFGITEYQKNLNEKYKKMAQLIRVRCLCPSLDLSIYDRRRLFRIPGSINSKSGLHKVQITREFLQESTYDSMKAWAEKEHDEGYTEPERIETAASMFEELFRIRPQDKVKQRKKAKAPQAARVKAAAEKGIVRKLSPCVQDILETGVGEGQRNNTAIVLASSLFQSGRDEDTVAEIMEEWNQLNDPPIEEQELATTIRSAYSCWQSDMNYGYTKISELGYCRGRDCKFYSKCSATNR